MNKTSLISVAVELTENYHEQAKQAQEDKQKEFFRISSLLEQTIIDYSDEDFSKAAKSFFEKKHSTGIPYSITDFFKTTFAFLEKKPKKGKSYSINDFLGDPNAVKQTRKTIDYLYEIINEEVTNEDISKQALFSLTNICLQYIHDITKKGPKGPNQELVLSENDTNNIKLFTNIINFYKPEYAQVILKKTEEILSLPLDNEGMQLSYAIKFRNFFLYSDLIDYKKAGLLEFFKSFLDTPKKIQNNITAKEFEEILGFACNEGKIGKGVIWYIANKLDQDPSIGSQGELHNYMNKVLFKTETKTF